MIRHLSVNIDFLLKKSDRFLGRFFSMDGAEARRQLLEKKANGHIKVASAKCEGFDPVTGCPGHKNEKFKELHGKQRKTATA